MSLYESCIELFLKMQHFVIIKPEVFRHMFWWWEQLNWYQQLYFGRNKSCYMSCFHFFVWNSFSAFLPELSETHNLHHFRPTLLVPGMNIMFLLRRLHSCLFLVWKYFWFCIYKVKHLKIIEIVMMTILLVHVCFQFLLFQAELMYLTVQAHRKQSL